MRILKVLGVVAILWFVLAAVHEGFVVKSYIRGVMAGETSTLTFSSGSLVSRTVVALPQVDESKRPPEIQPPRDHPPLRLIVGADSWTVHYTTRDALHARGCDGFENNATHEIWLPRKIIYSDARADLLHEILHAALSESRKGQQAVYDQDENSFVEPMAPQLLQVLQDNPTLVAWLTEAGR